MQELIQTERDYVRALGYVIENYIPEILQDSVPQPLRGKKNVIFENIEKIHDFHSRIFLSKIENCIASPYQLGSCFLMHVSVRPDEILNKFFVYMT
jgi:triple functional domain protein